MCLKNLSSLDPLTMFSVHFSAVNKITEDSVIDTEGNAKKVDTIVCATGFDVSYRPRFPIVGRDGVDLADKWKICPESYLGEPTIA